ncbi:Opacity protein [Fodinibius salinus]|uniref:Opacity protein n=1 Tax=Fodinibius salinus TaxID=860790 RepID=A0A5D3YFL1_9BACT|nr:outer membrane beta-barrel protein [Fodinibius salinus]TYP92005.1 Opacity protein [Fodinibius salinus]
MRLHKLLFAFAVFAFVISGIPQSAAAQWSIGASYEIRNEDPTNGFGVRLEREILSKMPVLNLGLRAHFSYFNDENTITQNNQSFSREITNYDYGVAATVGASIGLVSPYVGTGVGSTTTDVEISQLASGSENRFFWNGFVGAKVSPIPALKPFVEYRFQSAESFSGVTQNASFDSNTGRLIFGISFSF